MSAPSSGAEAGNVLPGEWTRGLWNARNFQSEDT